MATNGKVTMAVVATELKNLTQAVNRLGDKFDKHEAEDKLVAIDVDRLKQVESHRQTQINRIWTAIFGITGSVITGVILYFLIGA